MRPRPLLGQPLDQIDQRLDEVQDCGDKDDGLQGFVLIAAFLFPGHFVHLLRCFLNTLYLPYIVLSIHFRQKVLFGCIDNTGVLVL